MKKLTFLIPLILFIVTLSQTQAQTYSGKEAMIYVPKSIQVKINEGDKSIQYFQFPKNAAIKATHPIEFLHATLGLDQQYSFKLIQCTKDKLGMVHQKYEIHYQNIRIENSVFTLHIRQNTIESGSGNYSTSKNFSKSTPLITAEKALEIGKNNLKSQHYFWTAEKQPQPELCYLAIGKTTQLCYKTDIYSLEPLDRRYFYIDANAGKIINEINRIQHNNEIGTAHTRYSGTKNITTNATGHNFTLNETSRGNGINTYDMNGSVNYNDAVNFTDDDNNWTSTANHDDAALDAHFGAEAFYDYFESNFTRHSFDNHDAEINSYVHYNTNFVNAFWDGSNITYGDGDGTNYGPLTSLDVVGHELTHAITQHSAGLIYSYESGALNESFSDIFGVTIDYWKNPATANFLIGDQFALLGHNCFRNMADPKSKGQPSTYKGTYWVSNDSDYGGVHTNSSVQNYWYYLVVMGGSGQNDNEDQYTVTGIGFSKAADICYRTLTNYLTPSSNYADARFYSIKAAEDLFGSCSAEVIAVTNAWYAVGVGNSFTPNVFSNFIASNTYSCTMPATIHFTNTSINATQYTWDFGDGNTSTDENPVHVYQNQGSYTISLVANGSVNCPGTHTTSIDNYIQVSNSTGPSDASCSPQTLNLSTNGITNVSFNTINSSSQTSLTESFQDFTCTQQTTITAGKKFSLSISTSGNDFVKGWIDYNNDGEFTDEELICTSLTAGTSFTYSILIQAPTHYNIPLRMRIGADTQPLSTACSSPLIGQFEDYSVVILANSDAPEADFEKTETICMRNQNIQFTDKTLNLPTSWEWTFEGASTAQSNEQNPVVHYPNTGTYSVRLKVTNQNGADSLIKTGYISIVNAYAMCSTSSSNELTGTLFDSGWNVGDYQNSEGCTFLIEPSNVGNLYLHIKSFDSEENYDYLTVRDGTNSSAPIIASLHGKITARSYHSTSGSIFIQWSSDTYINKPGFEITWDTINDEIPGGISYSGNLQPNEPILFKSIDSTGSDYNWNIVNSSTTSNTIDFPYSFNIGGNYTINLSYTDLNGTHRTFEKLIAIKSTAGLFEATDEISIYPNPAATKLNIKCSPEMHVKKISLKNMLGQQIDTIEGKSYSSHFSINLEDYTDGIYFIELISENDEVFLHKVIKNAGQ